MRVPGDLGWPRAAAWAVVVAAAGWLLLVSPGHRTGQVVDPGGLAVVGLEQAWPDARVVDLPGVLDDGSVYTPLLYLDATTSLGVALTADGSFDRLLLRRVDGPVREVRRIRHDDLPQFLGSTRAGDWLYWAESTAPQDGLSRTQLWRWRLGDDEAPQVLTTDTGAAVFYETQFDLAVAEGRISWLAAAPGDTAVTELRSMLVDGGPVTIRTVPGVYQMTAWPWLYTAPGPRQARTELVNVTTGERRTLSVAATATLSCTPAWCLSIALAGPDGVPTLYELVTPDGSRRLRVGGPRVSAAIPDVALLDRFEPVRLAGTAGGIGAQLALYDIRAARLVVVADAVGQVAGRQGVLWWSTGGPQTISWHSLDLTTLTR